ncbi:hypothetical protein BAZO_20183 [Schinkia azotoformans LMG 9581]|uniref:ArsR family transcriptional regulator n=1 Tax=Schinkia azotoformans LMG 9581 TaxID=1131731 RepID=K6CR92_SCHAZ|nr:hypothetical protein BAZO_20183 [Schinkia azotoformans LMG 9581]
MLDILITSKTRVKLLVKFFGNPNTKSYLRELADEFGDSTNSIRIELNRMVETGLLNVWSEEPYKVYQANKQHEYFTDIHNIVLKMINKRCT